MEQNLIDRGFRMVTLDWPNRSKHWLYADGAWLSPEHGSLIVAQIYKMQPKGLL